MKNSNIAQDKTQAPSPDEMQDLKGQKLKKNQETANFFAKLFAKKAENLFWGKKLRKKKSTMAKEKFSHKKNWFTKELVEKNSQTKTLFWLGRSPHPTVGKIKHFCAYI